MIETCLAGRQPGALFRRTPAASSRRARFMKASHFDRLARMLTSGSSRRGLLHGLGGSAVGLTALQVPGWADAKKKHDADGKRKGKKKKKKKMTTSSTSPPPSPPPAPAPVTTVDAGCLITPPDVGEWAGPRVAQTFVAKRSGQLTSAMVAVRYNDEGADFELQIRDVNVGGTPTSTVLASTIIANVPAINGPAQTIVGTFTSPATVVAGHVYALVVTESPFTGSTFEINGSNPCPNGALFEDEFANDTFSSMLNLDLVYA